MTDQPNITQFSGQRSAQSQRPANWSFRTEAPADWQLAAQNCADRGEFDFNEIHAECERLQARSDAA